MFYHYSSTPITELHNVFYDLSKNKAQFWSGIKPRGLWISDDRDYGWAKWCNDNDFSDTSCQLKYEVDLDFNNLLYIKNKGELISFTAGYRTLCPGFTFEMYCIDWSNVYLRYKGIVITPYIWECRLDMHTNWYYGWDCASGCIWDVSAIKSFKEVPNYGQAQQAS